MQTLQIPEWLLTFSLFGILVCVILIVGIHIGRRVERSTWMSVATPGIKKPILYIKNQGYVVMISEEFDTLNLIEVREGTATH